MQYLNWAIAVSLTLVAGVVGAWGLLIIRDPWEMVSTHWLDKTLIALVVVVAMGGVHLCYTTWPFGGV